MKYMIASLSLAVLAFTGFKNAPHVDLYNLNKESSSLEWNAKKVTGEHYGTINFINGTLKHDHGSYSGNFEIDMNTIVVGDLSGNYKEKLENHLRSEDFFDVKNHPVSKLAITSVKRAATQTGEFYKINANLTIKGITNPIAFDANVKNVNNVLHFDGEIVVDRTKYDIKYRSGKFFPDIGDKMIYDDFTLKFNVALQKQ